MSDKDHWETVYGTKSSEAVSWFRPHLERSLAFVRGCGLTHDARIVDIGGGASTLVDDLLAEGYRNLAVLDLAEAALNVARARLGDRAASVDWIVGDVTTSLLPDHSVDLWHDRAVFHFLTGVEQRAAYVEQAARAVKPGGFVLIATFALDGPEKCSGLPVARYDATGLLRALGPRFERVADANERHRTPAGSEQSFVYCLSRRL